MARDSAQEFLAGEAAAETEVDEFARGERAGPFGRHGAFAVKAVVHVDGTPLAVGSHGDASTKVTDDEVQVFIVQAVLAGITAGNGALVKGVPDGTPRQQGRPREAGDVIEFVHHDRISRQGAASGQLCGQLGGDEATEVTGVLAGRLLSIAAHGLVDFIDAPRDGLRERPAPDNGVETERDADTAQLSQDEVLTESVLVGQMDEGGKFLHAVVNRVEEDRFLVVIDGNLGRGGPGIDG